MDLFVERQTVEALRAGDQSKFQSLFEANFKDLYKYVFRRLVDRTKAEEVVSRTFIDALSRYVETPTDSSFVVWLYSLAKPKVWDVLSKDGFPSNQGIVADESGLTEDQKVLLSKVEGMFSKLALEEREIMRLKFFEEVSDGDVMTILKTEDKTIGSKIYRVLKRAHFLLFGEGDDSQAVYFGELSGMMARLRDMENIEVPEVLKLNLKADLDSRLKRKDFAVDVEEVKEEAEPKKVGSDDPAKIFVQAVKELREEDPDRLRKIENNQFDPKTKRVFTDEEIAEEGYEYEMAGWFKRVLAVVPVLVVLFVVWFFSWDLFFGPKKIERGLSGTCEVVVDFDGTFSDNLKYSINRGISNRLCEHFEVASLTISRGEAGHVIADVAVPGHLLKYDFSSRLKTWKIKKYEKTAYSNEKSGEV